MSSVRILVVDDEWDQIDSLKKQLQVLEFPVVGEAKDAYEAIELTRQTRPDLVLMDIKIPAPNGIRAAEVIWRLYVTPVLFLTALEEREDSLRAGGAFGYLSKPVQAEALRTAIEAALYNYDEFNVRTQNYRLSLFGIDASGRLLSLSKSAEKFTGYSRDELVGRNFEVLLAPEARATSKNLVKEALNGRSAAEAKIRVVPKTGLAIPVEATYSAVCLNGTQMGISIWAWKTLDPLRGKWPGRNRRRLELIEKKYRGLLEKVEANELQDLQEEADNYVEPLGEIDPDRLKELRVIYENLKREEGGERGEA